MHFQKIIFFFFLTNSSNSSCTLLTEKAAYVANAVFTDFITSVVWWHDEQNDVTDFIKLFEGSIVVAQVQDNETSNEIIREFNIKKTFTQTVVFVAEVCEVEYFVSLLYHDLVMPVRLIVVLTKPTTDTELSQLMEIAWNNDVADILILSNEAKPVLTTYFPYKNGECGDFTPVHLNHDTNNLFPRKFMNFHGCEIRTTLLHMSPFSKLKFVNHSFVSMSGIDGDVLHILFDLLNARVEVVSAKDHGGLGTIINGTATGSFADLVNKKADILSPGLLMSIIIYPYVQFAPSHQTSTIVWLGPRRQELSEWLHVLEPFMSQITPALFGAFIVFTVVIMTIHRFRLHRSFSRDSVMFQTFSIFLGVEVKFETKSLLTNSLFVLWIWFCMVVRIAYQGNLVNGLQKTTLESPLRTFESSVKLVNGYGGIENVRDFFNGTRFYEQFKVIPLRNITKHLKAIEAGRRFLIATDRSLALDSAPNIQVLDDEPVTSGPVCFCMRPGWPAVADINNALVQMIEKGFVEKVFREHSWEWKKAVETKNDRGGKTLTLGTLIGGFYGLGVIYGVCTLVLFVEIIYYRIIADRKIFFFKRK